jgi:hypothetical protein
MLKHASAPSSYRHRRASARSGAVLLAAGLLCVLGGESAADPLAQGAISRVVESNRPSIRRSCWEPVLAAQASGKTASARVQAKLAITASGDIESVSAGGAERMFPDLSECIATSIRQWKFPASDAPTVVTVPFFFMTQ